MIRHKAAPSRQAVARPNSFTEHCIRKITQLVGGDRATEYIVLAAVIHHPDLAAPFIPVITKFKWRDDLLKVVASASLSHLLLLGRADLVQIERILRSAGTVSPHRIALELRTIAVVAELIRHPSLVAEAVAALTTDRKVLG